MCHSSVRSRVSSDGAEQGSPDQEILLHGIVTSLIAVAEYTKSLFIFIWCSSMSEAVCDTWPMAEILCIPVLILPAVNYDPSHFCGRQSSGENTGCT